MATLQATTFNTTDGVYLPKGTTAQRPVSPVTGMIRYNTTFGCDEVYNGSNWIDLRTGLPVTVTEGLMIRLDATLAASYPIGSSSAGGTWYDVSGYDNHFDVRTSARIAGPPAYMSFSGSYGVAKRNWQAPTASEITINDNNGGVTYVFATRMVQTNTDWRTLTRSHTANHHVMGQLNGWNLGMYDNQNGGGFLSSGYSQQSLPGYASNAWNILYVRFQSTSPYWQLSYNDTPGTIRGSITDWRARHLYGIQCLGGWSDSNGNVLSTTYQHWGDLGFFHCYNRVLTDTELLNIFQEMRGRYSL